jgi:cytochrome c oxidase assembly protein subunit 15
MVVVAGVLYHRSRHRYGEGARREVRCEWTVPLARVLWVLLTVTLLAGMTTTGSGPHSGGSTNQLVARRLPFSLQSAAWVHSVCAIAFIATVAGAYLVLARSGAPKRIVEGAGRLLAVGAAQGVLGVVQYATRLPVVLVELHVLGAVAITIGVLRFQLVQVARDAEPDAVAVAASLDAAPLVPATST